MTPFIKQAIKYGVVGASNTILTFIIYYILTEYLDYSKNISNTIGYIAGIINGFIWNKQWTFQKSGAWLRPAIIYILMFAACYSLQILLFNLLNARFPDSHIVNFIIAMLLYNVLFFLANKFIIFKSNIKVNLNK